MSTLMYKNKSYGGIVEVVEGTYITIDNGSGGTKTAQ